VDTTSLDVLETKTINKKRESAEAPSQVLLATTSFWAREPAHEQPVQPDVTLPDELRPQGHPLSLRRLPASQLLLRHLPGHQLSRPRLLEHPLWHR
jgi:hypothetical protein